MPAIVSGPMDLTLEYSDNLTVTFTCTAAFGESSDEIEFYWFMTSWLPDFTYDNTLNADNSVTQTITIIVFYPDHRETGVTCCVNNLYENCEEANLSIGKK